MMRMLIATLAISVSSTTWAEPQAPQDFCKTYPSSALCKSGAAECSVCHTTAPGLNAFGSDLSDALGGNKNGAAFSAALSAALKSIESRDSDQDGSKNGDEILAGTLPGLASSKPAAHGDAANQAPPASCEERSQAAGMNLCGRDQVFVFKRISRDICGTSPTYSELESFKRLSINAQETALNEQVAVCMQGEYWRGKEGVVWQVGYTKIGPSRVIKAGEDGGTIALADYYDDFNLWMYYNLDGRDVRNILTAQHYVVRTDGPTTYTAVEEMPLSEYATGFPSLFTAFAPVTHADGAKQLVQQFVRKSERAGLLTTNWAAASRTMFTTTPRTAASQAMRIFLGVDLAKSEGLVGLPASAPANFFQDYDNKGVMEPACAYCHLTLDPATYPFHQFNGLSPIVLGMDLLSAIGSTDSTSTTQTTEEVDRDCPSGIRGAICRKREEPRELEISSTLKQRLGQIILDGLLTIDAATGEPRICGLQSQVESLFASGASGGMSQGGDAGGIDLSTALSGGVTFPPELLAIFEAIGKCSTTMIPGSHHVNRLALLAPSFKETEPNLTQQPATGYLMGQPVKNVAEWGRVAANSDQFAQQMVRTYWFYFLGRMPSTPVELKEFETLWKSLKSADKYSIEAMIHRFIKTEAYGAP